LKNTGVLVFDLKNTDRIIEYQAHAVSVYQSARRRFENISLVGKGGGCALCIMLAERFSPERIILAPFTDSIRQPTGFHMLTALSKGMFAICADILLLLPENLPIRTVHRIKKLIGESRRSEKQIIFLKENESADEALDKLLSQEAEFIKALA